MSQKEELMRWVAEEKARTLKWCEEQQQAATRERNAAAKMARDSRQKALSGTVPIRWGFRCSLQSDFTCLVDIYTVYIWFSGRRKLKLKDYRRRLKR